MVRATERWAGGRISYRYAGGQAGYRPMLWALFNSAMNDYHSKTCIRFNRDDDDGTISFRGTGLLDGESETDGVGTQATEVKIDGLLVPLIGTAVHELGHLVGFKHTMTRTDRETYITFTEAACRKYARDNHCAGKEGATLAACIRSVLYQYRINGQGY